MARGRGFHLELRCAILSAGAEVGVRKGKLVNGQRAKFLRKFAVYSARQTPLRQRAAQIEHVYRGLKRQWARMDHRTRGEMTRRIRRELASAS